MDPKQSFWMGLMYSGYIDINPFDGIIWNRIANRQIGYVSTAGYVAIGWRLNGKIHHALVHRLIWWYAKGNIPDGLIINHKDGVKTNNSIHNLEIVTYSENTRHAMELGLALTLDRRQQQSTALKEYYSRNAHASNKFSSSQVIEIKKRVAERTVSIRAIAREYGVSHSTILRIISDEAYSYLRN